MSDNPSNCAENCPAETCSMGNQDYGPRFYAFATLLAAFLFFNCFYATWQGCTVLLVMSLTFLFGCWKTRRAVLVVVPAMQAPFLWVFVPLAAIAENIGTHLKSNFWLLPGVYAPLLADNDDRSHIWIAFALSLFIFFTAIYFARPSRNRALATALVLCIAMCVFSARLYSSYLS